MYKLRSIYKKFKIKKKSIKHTKIVNQKKQLEIDELSLKLSRQLRFLIEKGFRAVFLDEMMVTKRTIPIGDWSLPTVHSEIDLSRIDTKPIAVLGCISLENVFDLVRTSPKSINTNKFLIFLQELRDKYWADDIVIVMDNLSLHKCIRSKERMDEMGFEYLFTPPYSP